MATEEHTIDYAMEVYLKCTEFIDCDTNSVREKAEALTHGLETVREKADGCLSEQHQRPVTV